MVMSVCGGARRLAPRPTASRQLSDCAYPQAGRLASSAPIERVTRRDAARARRVAPRWSGETQTYLGARSHERSRPHRRHNALQESERSNGRRLAACSKRAARNVFSLLSRASVSVAECAAPASAPLIDCLLPRCRRCSLIAQLTLAYRRQLFARLDDCLVVKELRVLRSGIKCIEEKVCISRRGASRAWPLTKLLIIKCFHNLLKAENT